MDRNEVEQIVAALKEKVQDSHIQVEDLRNIALEALDAISNVHESVEADEDLNRGADVSSVTDELGGLKDLLRV